MTITSLKFEGFIKAPPHQVYNSFTNSTAIREWMCDVATTATKPGGRFYAAWNSGYYTSGEFIALEPDKLISFTWRGRGYPRDTQVSVTLKKKTSGTQLRLIHKGLGKGANWESIRQDIQYGWESGLENLISVLETGEDLRFAQRPMLGILTGEFNDAVAKRIGVPVQQGIHIDGVVDGMGAKAAGLQHDDVLVGMAGKEIRTSGDLNNALQRKRAGDWVDVTIYRGMEKMTYQMQLSKRPLPEIPTTVTALAKAAEKRSEEEISQINKFFGTITEEAASYKPAPDEWSAKEILAHLIHGHRGTQQYFGLMIGGHEEWADDWGGNIHALNKATVTAYPTLLELLEEYRRSSGETVALLANIPPEFSQRKSTFWRMGVYALAGPSHLSIHMVQFQEVIEAYKKNKSK